MSTDVSLEMAKAVQSARDTENSLMDAIDLGSLSSDDDQSGRSITTSKSVIRFFGNRQDDLFIELEEPHKTYGPGDLVRGQVNLTLRKDTKVLYTRIIFQGHVRIGAGKSRVRTMLFQKHLTLWGHSKGHMYAKVIESDRLSHGTGSTSSRHDNVYDDSGVGDWQTNLMRAGKHVFEFEFKFDSMSLPSTVDFGRGCIAYNLRCELQKPTTIMSRGRSTCNKDLTFSDNIDISNLAIPIIRHLESDFKTKDKSLKVHASVELVKSGFLKGESIVLNIHIDHVKAIKNMHGIIATFYRLSRFHSSDLAPQSFRKDLCQSISPLLIDPITLEYRVSTRLRAPTDVFPTVRSAGPVSFRYFVEVVLDLNSRASRPFSLSSRLPEAVSNNSHERLSIIETEALKRDRGIHCILFEIIIGTRRSTTEYRHRSDMLINPQGVGSQVSYDRCLPTVLPDTDVQRMVLARQSLDNCVSFSARPDQNEGSRNDGFRETQLDDTESQYPLSKLALQELESALLPSLPPEPVSDVLRYIPRHAAVPPSSLLDRDSR